MAHGGLAQEYLRAVQHVVGPMPNCATISIGTECNRDSKQQEILDAAREVDQGHGVVIVTDIFGGSPSNLSLPACKSEGRMILYGVNLPALIKLAKTRNRPIEEAVSKACDAGRKYIDGRKMSQTEPIL